MRTRVKDIAARAGVSHMTVSRVLRNSPHVHPATRERVLRALRELQYRPNVAARATRNGRFMNVALLLSTEASRSNLPPLLLEGLHDALAAAGYHLIVVRLPDERLTSEGVVPQILQEFSCDGLLVNYTDRIPERMIRLIRAHPIPCVWINVCQPHDAVYIDDEGGGRLATEYLLRMGHRRIAFVEAVRSFHYSMPARIAGYESAMRKAGLEPQVVRAAWEGNQDIVGRHRTLVEWFREGTPPSAVITYSYAPSVWLAAAEAGLTPPTALSIVVFENEVPSFGPYRMATVVTDRKALGEETVAMLLRKIENPDAAPEPSRTIPCRLEPGDTVRAPKS